MIRDVVLLDQHGNILRGWRGRTPAWRFAFRPVDEDGGVTVGEDITLAHKHEWWRNVRAVGDEEVVDYCRAHPMFMAGHCPLCVAEQITKSRPAFFRRLLGRRARRASMEALHV